MTAFAQAVKRGMFDGLSAPASKYRNRVTEVDGIKFASKAEVARWAELCLLEKGGVIFDLKRQVPFPLYVNDKLVASYIADFSYRNKRDGVLVVEDVKGVRTAVFNLKAKMFAAHYGFSITIIGGRK